MTEKQMIKIAKDEVQRWNGFLPGEVMIVLWAFIHRITTGRTIEETFFKDSEQAIDYQI